MRRYIRHPSSMPVDYRMMGGVSGVQRLRNISAGGVSFATRHSVEQGSPVHMAIRLGDRAFETDGDVVWSHDMNDRHEIGVRFRNAASLSTVRMVEQLCHIEQYRQQVRHTEGRELTSEQAAAEWVSRFHADFPGQE